VDAGTSGDNAACEYKAKPGTIECGLARLHLSDILLNRQLSLNIYRPSIMSLVCKRLDGEFGLAIKQLLPVLFSSR
jgi:hypothetical protein